MNSVYRLWRNRNDKNNEIDATMSLGAIYDGGGCFVWNSVLRGIGE